MKPLKFPLAIVLV